MSPRDAQEDFRLVYDGTYRFVLAYALRRTLIDADARDVVADTFLVAWRRFDVVPRGDDALPWLYGVARRVIANQRRSQGRQSQLLERIGTSLPAPIDVERSVITAHEGRTATSALRLLDPDDQELLCLVAWEELSYRQIATMLECTENAVAIRVHRTRSKLRRLMETLTGMDTDGHKRSETATVEGEAP